MTELCAGARYTVNRPDAMPGQDTETVYATQVERAVQKMLVS